MKTIKEIMTIDGLLQQLYSTKSVERMLIEASKQAFIQGQLFGFESDLCEIVSPDLNKYIDLITKPKELSEFG